MYALVLRDTRFLYGSVPRLAECHVEMLRAIEFVSGNDFTAMAVRFFGCAKDRDPADCATLMRYCMGATVQNSKYTHVPLIPYVLGIGHDNRHAEALLRCARLLRSPVALPALGFGSDTDADILTGLEDAGSLWHVLGPDLVLRLLVHIRYGLLDYMFHYQRIPVATHHTRVMHFVLAAALPMLDRLEVSTPCTLGMLHAHNLLPSQTTNPVGSILTMPDYSHIGFAHIYTANEFTANHRLAFQQYCLSASCMLERGVKRGSIHTVFPTEKPCKCGIAVFESANKSSCKRCSSRDKDKAATNAWHASVWYQAFLSKLVILWHTGQLMDEDMLRRQDPHESVWLSDRLRIEREYSIDTLSQELFDTSMSIKCTKPRGHACIKGFGRDEAHFHHLILTKQASGVLCDGCILRLNRRRIASVISIYMYLLTSHNVGYKLLLDSIYPNHYNFLSSTLLCLNPSMGYTEPHFSVLQLVRNQGVYVPHSRIKAYNDAKRRHKNTDRWPSFVSLSFIRAQQRQKVRLLRKKRVGYTLFNSEYMERHGLSRAVFGKIVKDFMDPEVLTRILNSTEGYTDNTRVSNKDIEQFFKTYPFHRRMGRTSVAVMIYRIVYIMLAEKMQTFPPKLLEVMRTMVATQLRACARQDSYSRLVHHVASRVPYDSNGHPIILPAHMMQFALDDNDAQILFRFMCKFWASKTHTVQEKMLTGLSSRSAAELSRFLKYMDSVSTIRFARLPAHVMAKQRRQAMYKADGNIANAMDITTRWYCAKCQVLLNSHTVPSSLKGSVNKKAPLAVCARVSGAFSTTHNKQSQADDTDYFGNTFSVFTKHNGTNTSSASTKQPPFVLSPSLDDVPYMICLGCGYVAHEIDMAGRMITTSRDPTGQRLKRIQTLLMCTNCCNTTEWKDVHVVGTDLLCVVCYYRLHELVMNVNHCLVCDTMRCMSTDLFPLPVYGDYIKPKKVGTYYVCSRHIPSHEITLYTKGNFMNMASSISP